MALLRSLALALLAAALISACGGGSSTSSSTPVRSAGPDAALPSAFTWLHPAAAPTGWRVAHLAGTGALAYPASWQRIRSDPGTASAALEQDHSDLVVDYLNATPQQGEETLKNWAAFRPDHNREEGDSHVQVLASAQGLAFRNGRGSCVIDRYRTPRTSYQEIACIVRGSRGTSVIVAAALAPRWAQAAPLLERAVSAFVA